MEEKQISEKESLDLIATMINKAKNAYHDTGMSSMLWGTVIAFCSLVKFAEIQFNFKLPFDIYLLAFIAIIPQILIVRKEKKNRTVRSYDDNYMDYIWLGFGICIFLLILILNVMSFYWSPEARAQFKLTGIEPDFRLNEYISPFFLLLYGLPTFITGAACKFKPMLWGGIFCWVCCVITVFTPMKVDLLLVSLAAIFAWLIPGIILEKDYRKAKKGLELANV